MYGLTEIQLIGNAVSYCTSAGHPIRRANEPLFLRIGGCLIDCSSRITGKSHAETLDDDLPKPITHGEWEARHQHRLWFWKTPDAQFTQSDIDEYERIRDEEGLPSVSRIVPARQKAGE